jgi:hypothetical protein
MGKWGVGAVVWVRCGKGDDGLGNRRVRYRLNKYLPSSAKSAGMR